MIHALTIYQPWAELLAAGQKTIEVRRWRRWGHAQRLVGKTICLHAGRQYDEGAPQRVQDAGLILGAKLRMGGIVGVARLVGVRPFRDYDEWVELAPRHLNPLDSYRPRLIGLHFAEARRFEDGVECRGQQGFWRVPADAAEEVERALCAVPLS